MPTISAAIVESANLSLAYAERLTKELPTELFARLAPGANGPVMSNHPAFVFGHLQIYAPRIIAELGNDASPYQPSEQDLGLFLNGVTCVDDPDGTIYPPMSVIMERFFRAHRAAIATIAETSDEIYASPNPNEKMRSKFATMGSMHAFYMGGHIMMHLGQVSAWRRMLQLPPA